ncbi:MAG: hypothetical protein Q9227_003009 [Pyrenula ochraceoflavens]
MSLQYSKDAPSPPGIAPRQDNGSSQSPIHDRDDRTADVNNTNNPHLVSKGYQRPDSSASQFRNDTHYSSIFNNRNAPQAVGYTQREGSRTRQRERNASQQSVNHHDLNTRYQGLGRPFGPFDAEHSQQANDQSFSPYQPLRFNANPSSSGHVPASTHRWQSSMGQTASTSRPRPRGTSWRPAPDQAALPSRSQAINPAGPRPGLEALTNSRPPPREQRRTFSSPRTVSPPPAPAATDVYLAQSKLPTVARESAKRLLLVLDLNGTLIVRVRRSDPATFKRRPDLEKFFDYIFQNHEVMIYTSSQQRTVDIVLPLLFTQPQLKRLVAIWTRDKLDLTPEQFKEKVQVYKRLEKIWADRCIQACYPEPLGEWNQTNTILIDDSHLKALAQPHNLLQVPELMLGFKRQWNNAGDQVLESVILKLEELKHQVDVSRLIRLWQTKQREPPRLPLKGFDLSELVGRNPVNSTNPGIESEEEEPYSPEDKLAGQMAHMSTDGDDAQHECQLDGVSESRSEDQILLPGLSVTSKKVS